MSKRAVVSAEEFCVAVRDGTHDSPKEVEHGPMLVTSRHIVGRRLDLTSAYCISAEDFEKINRRSKVDRWDVLISMIGTVGEPCLVVDRPDFAIKNVGLFKCRNELEGKWLFYYLCSPTAQQLIREQSRGTTQAYVPLSVLRQFPLSVPKTSSETASIVGLLSSLDDKIEINRRMNETLEGIGRAIFKSWFVDFDPVRAKMEGRQPLGMSAETAALFPAAFEDSAIGIIPEGWAVSSVAQEYDYTMGQSPPGSSYNETKEGVPLFQGKGEFGFRFPTVRLFCTQPGRMAARGDTLVSVRAPVGAMNMARCECCIGRGLAAVQHKSGGASFTYYSMRALEGAFGVYDAEGTVFGSISKDSFGRIPTLYVPPAVLSAADEILASLDGLIALNEDEQITLAGLRDSLLPKLISGELRLREGAG